MVEFSRNAAAMREAFEARVGPARALDQRRFVWDYWHVPGQYTYLRTSARNVFAPALYGAFMAELKEWSRTRLGCTRVAEPWLSFYVSGCRQEFHTDARQGAFAYVFSLTKWDERRFGGGETLLMRPAALDYWAHHRAHEPDEADALLGRVAPRFNQLLVFDARVPHGVARVEGTQDPLDSRVVLHGWLAPADLSVDGALRPSQVEPVVEPARARWRAGLTDAAGLTGVLVLRASVQPSGALAVVEVASTTLVSTARDATAGEVAAQRARDELAALRLPAAHGTSTIVVTFSAASP